MEQLGQRKLGKCILQNLVKPLEKQRETQGSVDSQGKLRIRMEKLGKRMEKLGERMENLGKCILQNLVKPLKNKGKRTDPWILKVN